MTFSDCRGDEKKLHEKNGWNFNDNWSHGFVVTNLGISRTSSRLGPTPRSRYFEIGFLEQCPQVGDFFGGIQLKGFEEVTFFFFWGGLCCDGGGN